MNIPLTLLRTTIPANGIQSFNSVGKYLRVIKCPQKIEAQFNESGAIFPIYDSFYCRTETPFTSLKLYNRSNAPADIELFVADAEVGDNVSNALSITGIVNIERLLAFSEIVSMPIAAGGTGVISNSTYPNARSFLIVNESTVPVYVSNGSQSSMTATGKSLCLRPWDSLSVDVRGGFKVWNLSTSAALVKVLILNAGN